MACQMEKGRKEESGDDPPEEEEELWPLADLMEGRDRKNTLIGATLPARAAGAARAAGGERALSR